jgi:hypothetical protein
MQLIELDIEVRLNSTHTAKVSKEKVVVGCQEFTFDAIEKLWDAIGIHVAFIVNNKSTAP